VVNAIIIDFVIIIRVSLFEISTTLKFIIIFIDGFIGHHLYHY
jgi:hypothetical protein